MHEVFGMAGHTAVIRRAFEQYHGQVFGISLFVPADVE
jgi:hypothetical protein